MIELGGVVIAVVLLVALFFGLLANRLQQKIARQNDQIQTLQRDLRSLCSAAVHVGERLGRIERTSSQLSREQKILSQKQSQTTIKVASADESAFDQALKLAQKGATAEEMADICNVTRGEADLIAMMHRLEKEGEDSTR
ncbi:MAG: DUF2802 domain-containing protein [Chromatiales bacterium]|nr:DUF2802 domain-containing protein [Chromatiales bacterium]